ncbi:MAG TPA: hypothetical protein VK425_03100, partial [Acidimicrobiales bacterium]|nr:hypothetical protein [Acidimicrobiales bacterium]
AAVKLNADFAKRFTAKEASLLRVGTADIEEGVNRWTNADLLAAHGEFTLTSTHSCDTGEKLFIMANKTLLSSLRLMEAGSGQLRELRF